MIPNIRTNHCSYCEAQAKTIEALQAANERWVIAFNQAADEERAKIVAWLRGFATNHTDDLADILETQWPFDKEK